MNNANSLLREKEIILISPQPWSDMHISKHHYAIELAKCNNIVYFINPVQDKRDFSLGITKHESISNLHIVNYSSFIPYWFKFHWRSLFNIFLNWHVRRIIKKIDRKIDIIWDFDCNNLYENLDLFGAKMKIFHPVDQGAKKLPPTKIPDIIFSVSNDILETYKDIKKPKYFINHGLGSPFLAHAQECLDSKNIDETISDYPLKIGYIGNLTVPPLNRSPIMQLIEAYPSIDFHFWGPYDISVNTASDIVSFIEFLKSSPNVVLYGKKNPTEILPIIKNMDALLLNYKATTAYNADNTHKILEYFSLGKVVISSRLKVYKDEAILRQAKNDEEWISYFNEVIQDLAKFNKKEKQLERISFAVQNSYPNQIKRIEFLLLKHLSNRFS
ncbi:MAG: glycosyltransferase family 4 protein [Cyanothece sp. SIO1E1]|nr:glycosyltransferase family 4 protein [Cyanothece sp. SIO1E1]